MNVKKMILNLILLIFSILFVIGFFIEPNKLVVNKMTLELDNWDENLDNLKISVIADIHAGMPYINSEKLEEIVKLSNEQNPDLVLLPGDFVTSGIIWKYFVNLDELSDSLSKLKSKYGIIAVLGNNDWKYNGDKVVSALKKINITVLENDAIELKIDGKSLWIAGLADLRESSPDLERTLSKTDNNNPVIMISHNPDVFPFIPKKVNLTLSGHTHGGQVNLPLLGRLIVPSGFGSRYACGFFQENNKNMYVSSGIGTSSIPVRFRVIPEIDILTIKSK